MNYLQNDKSVTLHELGKMRAGYAPALMLASRSGVPTSVHGPG